MTNAINLFAGGGTIDTNGNNITITQVFQNPASSGVSAAPLVTDSTTVISAPPPVTFAGGTFTVAVSGYATLDPSGHINGIIITNPGSYTVAPTSVTVAGSTETFTPTLTANSTGGLTKIGVGTLTLTGANTYSGGTTVSQGTMIVTGSISGTSGVTVGSGALPASLIVASSGALGSSGTPFPSLAVGNNGTLSGNGTNYGANDATTSGAGTVAPSAGNTAGLTVGSSSTLQLSLANSQGASQPLASDYSKLSLGAGVSVTLGGTLVTLDAFHINRGDLFTIIIGNTGATPSSISGTFSNANSTKVGATTYQYQSGGAVINYGFSPTAWASAPTKDLATFDSITGGYSVALYNVPEPSSLAMLLASLGVTLGLPALPTGDKDEI